MLTKPTLSIELIPFQTAVSFCLKGHKNYLLKRKVLLLGNKYLCYKISLSRTLEKKVKTNPEKQNIMSNHSVV